MTLPRDNKGDILVADYAEIDGVDGSSSCEECRGEPGSNDRESN